ncbi:hypothetical protein F8B92_25580, partial [Escherichia coli]|nr:hypothetical protein [Escherichia coli]MDU9498101.1 hypothetical protein [Escherichia coli]
MRQQQDEPGRFSICSRQAAVVHPDVAGAQGVLQLGQGADFVEFPVEAFRGDHQRLPARLDEGRG